MIKQITTGAAIAGGVALQPDVAGVLADVAGWLHLTINAGAWSAVVLAIVGVVIHAKTPEPPAFLEVKSPAATEIH